MDGFFSRSQPAPSTTPFRGFGGFGGPPTGLFGQPSRTNPFETQVAAPVGNDDPQDEDYVVGRSSSAGGVDSDNIEQSATVYHVPSDHALPGLFQEHADLTQGLMSSLLHNASAVASGKSIFTSLTQQRLTILRRVLLAMERQSVRNIENSDDVSLAPSSLPPAPVRTESEGGTEDENENENDGENDAEEENEDDEAAEEENNEEEETTEEAKTTEAPVSPTSSSDSIFEPFYAKVNAGEPVLSLIPQFLSLAADLQPRFLRNGRQETLDTFQQMVVSLLDGDAEARSIATQALLALGAIRGSIDPIIEALRGLSVSSAQTTEEQTRVGAVPWLLKLNQIRRHRDLCVMLPEADTSSMSYHTTRPYPGTYTSITTDGAYLYVFARTGGLSKVGTGFNGSISGVVYANQPHYRSGEYGTLAFCGGRLFYRSVNIAPSACVAIDVDSLLEVATFRTNVDNCALPPALPLGGSDSTDHAHMTSPLFSDGNYLYSVLEVSSSGSKSKKDEKKFALEMYDPRQNLVLVRRTELPAAQSSLSQTAWCSSCQRFDATVERFKCDSCSNFFLCKECKEQGIFMNGSHDASHSMTSQTDTPSKKGGDNSPLSLAAISKGCFYTNGHQLALAVPSQCAPISNKRAVVRLFDLRDGAGHISDVQLNSFVAGMSVCFDAENNVLYSHSQNSATVITWRNYAQSYPLHQAGSLLPIVPTAGDTKSASTLIKKRRKVGEKPEKSLEKPTSSGRPSTDEAMSVIVEEKADLGTVCEESPEKLDLQNEKFLEQLVMKNWMKLGGHSDSLFPFAASGVSAESILDQFKISQSRPILQRKALIVALANCDAIGRRLIPVSPAVAASDAYRTAGLIISNPQRALMNLTALLEQHSSILSDLSNAMSTSLYVLLSLVRLVRVAVAMRGVSIESSVSARLRTVLLTLADIPNTAVATAQIRSEVYNAIVESMSLLWNTPELKAELISACIQAPERKQLLLYILPLLSLEDGFYDVMFSKKSNDSSLPSSVSDSEVPNAALRVMHLAANTDNSDLAIHVYHDTISRVAMLLANRTLEGIAGALEEQISYIKTYISLCIRRLSELDAEEPLDMARGIMGQTFHTMLLSVVPVLNKGNAAMQLLPEYSKLAVEADKVARRSTRCVNHDQYATSVQRFNVAVRAGTFLLPWLADVAKTAGFVAALCPVAFSKSGASSIDFATLPLLSGGVDGQISDARVPELAAAYKPHSHAVFLEQVANQTVGSVGAALSAYALKSSPAHLQFGEAKSEVDQLVTLAIASHIKLQGLAAAAFEFAESLAKGPAAQMPENLVSIQQIVTRLKTWVFMTSQGRRTDEDATRDAPLRKLLGASIPLARFAFSLAASEKTVKGSVLDLIQKEHKLEELTAGLAAQRERAISRLVGIRNSLRLLSELAMSSSKHDLLRYLVVALRANGAHYAGGLEGAGVELHNLLRQTWEQLIQHAYTSVESHSADELHRAMALDCMLLLPTPEDIPVITQPKLTAAVRALARGTAPQWSYQLPFYTRVPMPSGAMVLKDSYRFSVSEGLSVDTTCLTKKAQYSIAMWILLPLPGDRKDNRGTRTLLYKASDDKKETLLAITILADNRLEFQFSQMGPKTLTIQTAPVTFSQFTHVALTVDESHCVAYMNGVVCSEQSYKEVPMIPGRGPFLLNRLPSGTKIGDKALEGSDAVVDSMFYVPQALRPHEVRILSSQRPPVAAYHPNDELKTTFALQQRRIGASMLRFIVGAAVLNGSSSMSNALQAVGEEIASFVKDIRSPDPLPRSTLEQLDASVSDFTSLLYRLSFAPSFKAQLNEPVLLDALIGLLHPQSPPASQEVVLMLLRRVMPALKPDTLSVSRVSTLIKILAEYLGPPMSDKKSAISMKSDKTSPSSRWTVVVGRMDGYSHQDMLRTIGKLPHSALDDNSVDMGERTQFIARTSLEVGQSLVFIGQKNECEELAKRVAAASIPVRVERYEDRKYPSNTQLDAAPPHRVLQGPALDGISSEISSVVRSLLNAPEWYSAVSEILTQNLACLPQVAAGTAGPNVVLTAVASLTVLGGNVETVRVGGRVTVPSRGGAPSLTGTVSYLHENRVTVLDAEHKTSHAVALDTVVPVPSVALSAQSFPFSHDFVAGLLQIASAKLPSTATPAVHAARAGAIRVLAQMLSDVAVAKKLAELIPEAIPQLLSLAESSTPSCSARLTLIEEAIVALRHHEQKILRGLASGSIVSAAPSTSTSTAVSSASTGPTGFLLKQTPYCMFGDGGLEVSFFGADPVDTYVVANKPISGSRFYFEMTVTNMGANKNISMGLMPVDNMPGFGQCAYTYSANGGKKARPAHRQPGVQYLKCSYCGQQGLTDYDICQHLPQMHPNSSIQAVCIICAAQPWGDPSYFSQNPIDHLHNRHSKCTKVEDPTAVDEYSQEFVQGDVVGCGLRHGRIYFTRNGKYLGPAFVDISSAMQLVPVLRLGSNACVVKANFGQSKFSYTNQEEKNEESAAEALRERERASKSKKSTKSRPKVTPERLDLAKQLEGFTGYNEEYCVFALEKCGDNLEAAAEWAMFHYEEFQAQQEELKKQEAGPQTAAEESVTVSERYIEGNAYEFEDDRVHQIGGKVVVPNPNYVRQRMSIDALKIGTRVSIEGSAQAMCKASGVCRWMDAMSRTIGMTGTVQAVDTVRFLVLVAFYDSQRALQEEWWYPMTVVSIAKHYFPLPHEAFTSENITVVTGYLSELFDSVGALFAARCAVEISRAGLLPPKSDSAAVVRSLSLLHTAGGCSKAEISKVSAQLSSAEGALARLLKQLKEDVTTASKAITRESKHPYIPGPTTSECIEVPGASEVIVCFDPQSNIDGGGALCFFSDSAYSHMICRLTGDNRQLGPVSVNGDRVFVQFRTKDENLGKQWGYSFDVHGVPPALYGICVAIPQICNDDTSRALAAETLATLIVGRLPPPVRAVLSKCLLELMKRGAALSGSLLAGLSSELLASIDLLPKNALPSKSIQLLAEVMITSAQREASLPDIASTVDSLSLLQKMSLAARLLKCLVKSETLPKGVLRASLDMVRSAAPRAPLVKDSVPTTVFRSALEEVFAKFDKDNDGFLNEDELHALQMACQGTKMTPELLRHIRANFEVDEKQRLTRQGLLQLYTKEVLSDEENVWMELGKFGVMHCFPSAQPPKTDSEIEEALSGWTPAMDQQLVDLVGFICGPQSLNPLTLHPSAIIFAPSTRKLFPLIESRSASALQLRFAVLRIFNELVEVLLPYVDLSSTWQGRESFGQTLCSARGFMFTRVKSAFIDRVIRATATDKESPEAHVDRLQSKIGETPQAPSRTLGRAGRTAAAPKHTPAPVDKVDETVFGQIFKQLRHHPAPLFRQSGRCFKVTFRGENAEGEAGPYREALTNVCSDLVSPDVPLLIPCSNRKLAQEGVGIGENRDKYVLNPSATKTKELDMMEFLGRLMAIALRSRCPMALDLPATVWKPLVGDKPELRDLRHVDQFFVDSMERLLDMDPQTFEDAFSCLNFTVERTDGVKVPLKPDGEEEIVTYESRQEYVKLCVEARLNEAAEQQTALCRGFWSLIPRTALRLLQWKELELLVCGSPTIDMAMLRRHTLYRGLDAGEPVVRFFWEVLEDFPDTLRAQFLRFAWGRLRLPPESELAAEKMKIFLYDKPEPDKQFPHAETCFFNLQLPRYTNRQTLKERFEYAIQNTMAMDADPTHTFNGPGTGRPSFHGGADDEE